MGLDSYAALPVVEKGKRTLLTDLPGKVTYSATRKAKDGSIYTVTRKTAFGFDEVPPLAGGLFSGNGFDGSFRGKCYAALVEEITGYSLYEDELPPPVVKEMAGAMLQASNKSPLPCDAEKALDLICEEQKSGKWDTKLQASYDIYAMAKYFQACAAMGYSVVSWY